ncbi:MAG: leucine-rich repeat domain-containing protein [Solobacterium sp.]|nr:leucine-rich repeat domain-containing protein [Solobacterium sp.]
MKEFVVDESRIVAGHVIDGIFAEDETLENVIIPEGAISIGPVAFYGCRNLKKIQLPQSLRVIGERAFSETGLEEILVPERVERICESALYGSEHLRSVQILGKDTIIEKDVFGCCDNVVECFIGCGFPELIGNYEEVQYTLFYLSSYKRHDDKTGRRARKFISENQDLIMEWIIKANNVPALKGIFDMNLLQGDNDAYITKANESGRVEITSILMNMHMNERDGGIEL